MNVAEHSRFSDVISFCPPGQKLIKVYKIGASLSYHRGGLLVLRSKVGNIRVILWSCSMRRSFLALMMVCMLVMGCAGRGGSALRAPESNEERAFQFLSAFYCKEKRWPAGWDEFTTFALPRDGGGELIGSFSNVQLSSPRAILLTLDYNDSSGTSRRVSFIAPPQCSTNSDRSVVSMAAGRVWFKLPYGFAVLGGKEIEERWKRPPYPDAAWEDSISGVVIAVRFGEVELPAGGMSAIKSKLEKSYEAAITNLSWRIRKIKMQGSTEFLLHEYESDSVKGRLLTASLTFGFDGKLLTINVVGPADQRHAVETVAEAVHASFRLE